MTLSPLYHCSCQEVMEVLLQISKENASIQRILVEVRILLEQFIKQEASL
jgi:hypothetical protein